MTKEKRIQAILNSCEQSMKEQPHIWNLLHANFASYISCNNSMYLMNELNWYKEYLHKQDVKSTKQRIYNCGRLLDMRESERNTHMQFDMRDYVKTMILSDSQELLERFKSWKYDDYTYPNSQGKRIVSMTTFIQKLLRGNSKEIQKEFELYLQYEHQYTEGKKLFFTLEKDLQIMKGLMEGDKDAIVDGLRWILSDRVFKMRSGPFEFFSGAATAYLKVAWILGYEIEIDSPYIPMDLMPIQPLEKYEVPYFFMDGYEGEYPEGWLEWKAKQDLGIPTAVVGSVDFVWDKNKYASRQEAIIIEAALKKGYRIEKDEAGNSVIYNLEGKRIGEWKRDV